MSDLVGTLIYQAPEMLSCMSKYHESADMWQIGVVTYCMLTGRFPYNPHSDLAD
jgi:serine/threonine protein kinase